jgi:hypothetical protein
MLEIIELETLLNHHHLDITNWSHNLGTKNIQDLHNEILRGETILEIRENQLVRITQISSIEVLVKMGEKTFTLIEDKQIFFTGAIRKRGLRNLSEKIGHNETPELAAYRALAEEIGLKTGKQLVFIGETEIENESLSYPGLYSRYRIFNYQINLDKQDLELMRFSEYQQQKITFFTLD